VIPASGGYRTVTDYSIDMHVRIPLSLMEKIEAFCKTMNKRNRNEGVRDLLKVALIFHENALLIQKNPNRIEEIHNQLKEGELVDSIQKIQGKDFHILYDIVVSEYKARFGSKLLKNI
jgi:metal-responsive CopG/Arc/MetJ family transcriptional regulator